MTVRSDSVPMVSMWRTLDGEILTVGGGATAAHVRALVACFIVVSSAEGRKRYGSLFYGP